MKIIKCRCGERIAVLDKPGSLYVVRCPKCDLKAINIFIDKKGQYLRGKDGAIEKQEKVKKGEHIVGYW